MSSDVAVPIARLADMFLAIKQISCEEGVAIPTFAHAGDGNLHPSVIVDPPDAAARDHGELVLDRVSGAALALGGTLSGEHGIGSLKQHALPKQLDPATLAAHRLVKDAFDPSTSCRRAGASVGSLSVQDFFVCTKSSRGQIGTPRRSRHLRRRVNKTDISSGPNHQK